MWIVVPLCSAITREVLWGSPKNGTVTGAVCSSEGQMYVWKVVSLNPMAALFPHIIDSSTLTAPERLVLLSLTPKAV